MNVAAILALLLHSGVCAKTDFNGADGHLLRVIVCPVMQAPAGGDAPEPSPDAPPTAPKPEERRA